jgi:hypothetical protein
MMGIAFSLQTSGRDAPYDAVDSGAHASMPSPVPAPGGAFDTKLVWADGACETRSKTRLIKPLFGLILLDGTIG